jgi:hypothetical protein
MKQIFILTLIVFAAAFGAFGQAKDKRNEKVIEEIKKMDRQWIIEAYSSKDLKDFDRIVADDFLITAGNGKFLTKAQKRASVAADYTEPSTVASPDFIFKIEERSVNVRVFGKTAVSNGYIIENYMYKGSKINNRVYFTNTYLKRDGRWQVVASQFTNAKQ